MFCKSLWIAFVLCTFGLIYSAAAVDNGVVLVVNCFRSLYLWVDLQPEASLNIYCECCELLSFFVPLGWFTAGRTTRARTYVLWIAFVLCTFGLIYSTSDQILKLSVVVNCFRSLYLWVDLQPAVNGRRKNVSCELLSFFVPLGWFTAAFEAIDAQRALWIAFVLCTFGLIYSCCIGDCRLPLLWIAFVLCTFGLIYSSRAWFSWRSRVVNCFRSLYLWVDLQPPASKLAALACCELLSFFVPLGWFTALKSKPIVSCCCELLSFFVPLGWFTANSFSPSSSLTLWIAFVLCTFGLIYSHRPDGAEPRGVVNCFRSLYLWVDLQHPQGVICPIHVVNCFRSLYLWVDLQQA